MSSGSEEGRRPLVYGPARHAVHIKLTERLKEALLEARASGQPVSLCLGGDVEAANVFKVGEESFSFKAHPLATCDLVRVPTSNTEEPCEEVAQLQQRLHIQRKMDGQERERVRLRGLEAERNRKERKAQVLERAPKPGTVRKVTKMREPTPPQSGTARGGALPPSKGRTPAVGGSRPTPQPSRGPTPQPSRGSTPRGPTPPPRPAAALQPPQKSPLRPPSPSAGLVPAAAKAKNALSKFGKGKKANVQAGKPTAVANAPPLAIEAARRNFSLRKCIIACIGHDKPKRPRLDLMLQDISANVPSFQPSKSEVSRLLKEVAEYKAPGVYVLFDYTLRKELPGLQQEIQQAAGLEPRSVTASPSGTPAASSEDTDPRAPSRKPSPEPVSARAASMPAAPPRTQPPEDSRKRPAGTSEEPYQQRKKPKTDPSRKAQSSKKADSSAEQNAESGQRQSPSPHGGKLLKERWAGAGEGEQAQQKRAGGAEGQTAPQKQGDSKHAEVKEGGGVGSQEHGQTTPQQPERSPSPPAANERSPPSPTPSPSPRRLSESPEQPVQPGTCAVTGLLASFASTSSDATDDSWFEAYVREPELGRAPPDTREAFTEMYAQHDLMFATYQRLYKRISRFCRDYESLLSSAETAVVPDEAKSWAKEAATLYDKHCARVRRQDQAMRTIHAELTEMKELMAKFIGQDTEVLPPREHAAVHAEELAVR